MCKYLPTVGTFFSVFIKTELALGADIRLMGSLEDTFAPEPMI